MLSLHPRAHGRLIDMLPSRASARGTMAFAASLLLAAMLAAAAALTFRASDRREEAEAWEAHTVQTLQATVSLRLAALGTLRGERGYLLTGDESFLEPYFQARTQIAGEIERLRTLVRSSPRQRARLSRVEIMVADHLRTMAALIALERAGRRDEAIQRIRAGEGRRSIEAIAAELDRLEAVERELLAQRTEVARKAAAESAFFVYLLCIVGLGLVSLATVAAVALRRSLLRESLAKAELQRMAATDELTGLANRRQIFHALDWLVGATRRSGRPLSVAILDIDHFKRVNDTHGHPAGDEVIRRIAQMAIEIMRDQDLVGRLGGEEFIIAMPDTDAGQALLACERLRQAIGELSILLSNGHALAITLSIGIAQHTAEDDRIHLIARADEALYAAKQQGRDRVLLAA